VLSVALKMLRLDEFVVSPPERIARFRVGSNATPYPFILFGVVAEDWRFRRPALASGTTETSSKVFDVDRSTVIKFNFESTHPF